METLVVHATNAPNQTCRHVNLSAIRLLSQRDMTVIVPADWTEDQAMAAAVAHLSRSLAELNSILPVQNEEVLVIPRLGGIVP